MLEVVVKGFHFLSEASRTNRFGLGCPLEKKVGFSEGLESSPLDSSLDFITWTIWILKCRTAFGFAVRRSFTAVGGAPLPPTAAFPLPIPYPTVWHGGGPGLSKLRFKKLAMKRLLNLVVLALDFQYLGRAPTAEEIGRCPNKWQVRCYDRLRTLLAACGTDPEPFPLAPGRSGPELGACLFQLEQFLAKPLLLERGYRERLGADFVDDPSIFPEELYPQLRPYRSMAVEAGICRPSLMMSYGFPMSNRSFFCMRSILTLEMFLALQMRAMMRTCS